MVDVTRTHHAGESRVHALRNVSLSVSAGEFVAVMGASGSGKSTLLNIAGGLDLPTTGEVRVLNQPLNGLSRRELARIRRQTIGYVFQSFNLLPSLTAAENVAIPLELDGENPRDARRQAREALARVAMDDLRDRFPDQLSGGQQQRIAVARALVGRRRMILADEPTGALDTRTGDTVLGLLREQVDRGASCVLVTHNAEHAAWADRTIVLRDGAIIGESSRPDQPDDLLETPR